MPDPYARIRMALEMGPTKGPWRVAPAANYAGSELNVDAQLRGYICQAGTRGDEQAEADAYLIAACDPDTIRALLGERDALAKTIPGYVSPAGWKEP